MQKLQISIPEPCHEDWQQMTPTEQGRFCNACAKEVIDFSTMTDTQVLNYFTSLTHEKVCGRALPEQLDRTLSLPEQPKKKLFWYWNYVVMFFMFFTKGTQANAQTCSKPATELNPLKNTVGNEEVIMLGGVQRAENRAISGKVTDVEGNPVSFASVKIKGRNTGVSADADGVYSIKVNNGDILEIAGAGFKQTSVPVDAKSVYNTVLDKGARNGLTEVVVGGAIWTGADEYYGPLDKLNRVAVIQVKDEESGKLIPGAGLIIQRRYAKTVDTAITDKKGLHKIKGIKSRDAYAVKITAAGYEPTEFTIDEYDFKNRKKEWEVLLRKQQVETTKPVAVQLPSEQAIRIRGEVFVNRENKGALYVVDGTIMPSGKDLRPEDVDSYTVLKATEAKAIFGADGENGAVVITTRKTKQKTLDTVAVSSEFGYKRRVAGGMGYTITYTRTYLTDVKARIATVLTDSLKVYPNPVQRNSSFAVSLKLKEAGTYQLQITDATGRIVLQKQINSVEKKHTETIPSQNWSAGLYQVRIFGKNQLISKAGFIVQ